MKRLPKALLLDQKAKGFVERSSIEPGVAYASRIAGDGIPFSTVGVRLSSVSSQVRHVLAVLGIAPAVSALVDPVAEHLARRYGCGAEHVWRRLLGAEYGHALQQVIRAESLFDIGRSEWLNYQNSFNHALYLAFQKHLNLRRLPGACVIVGNDHRLKKYGSQICAGGGFDNAHPDIARGFREANTRRNKLPSSHPYDEKTQRRNRHLKRHEQRQLVAELKASYAALTSFCLAQGFH